MAKVKFVGKIRTRDSAPRDPSDKDWPKDKSGQSLITNPIGQSRKWLKLWIDPWLSGTVHFTLDHRERAVWIDLLALAGQSRIGGVICAGIESAAIIGIPLLRLAGLVEVPENELTQILAKLEQQDRLKIRRDRADRLVISINNWAKYQADYSKQARYKAKRRKEKQPGYQKATDPITQKATDPTAAKGDGEGEGEVEGEAEEEERKRGGASLPTPTPEDISRAYEAMKCQPFGSEKFRVIWTQEWLRRDVDGTFADYMERAIQRCKSLKISIPGMFYTMKREIEKTESAAAGHELRSRTPL